MRNCGGDHGVAGHLNIGIPNIADIPLQNRAGKPLVVGGRGGGAGVGVQVEEIGVGGCGGGEVGRLAKNSAVEPAGWGAVVVIGRLPVGEDIPEN